MNDFTLLSLFIVGESKVEIPFYKYHISLIDTKSLNYVLTPISNTVEIKSISVKPPLNNGTLKKGNPFKSILEEYLSIIQNLNVKLNTKHNYIKKSVTTFNFCSYEDLQKYLNYILLLWSKYLYADDYYLEDIENFPFTYKNDILMIKVPERFPMLLTLFNNKFYYPKWIGLKKIQDSYYVRSVTTDYVIAHNNPKQFLLEFYLNKYHNTTGNNVIYKYDKEAINEFVYFINKSYKCGKKNILNMILN